MICIQCRTIEQIVLQHFAEFFFQQRTRDLFSRKTFEIPVSFAHRLLRAIDLLTDESHGFCHLLRFLAGDLESPHLHDDAGPRQVKRGYYPARLTSLFPWSIEDDFVFGCISDEKTVQHRVARSSDSSEDGVDLRRFTHVVEL